MKTCKSFLIGHNNNNNNNRSDSDISPTLTSRDLLRAATQKHNRLTTSSVWCPDHRRACFDCRNTGKQEHTYSTIEKEFSERISDHLYWGLCRLKHVQLRGIKHGNTTEGTFKVWETINCTSAIISKLTTDALNRLMVQKNTVKQDMHLNKCFLIG